MPTWMINGPGQALYLGNRGVSQFDPSGQVSPGSGYIPDEVAKQLVKEAGLRKSDTISKRTIVEYLGTMGLSAGLATDVAMVLRNAYGVTPTFDESTLYSRSGVLIEELMGVVRESYPAPFRVDAPEILNEMDDVGKFIFREYLNSRDEEYDVILEHFAALDPHDFLDIAEFYEWIGHEGFNYLADLVEHAPDGMAEQVIEGLCYPERVMSESVEFHLNELIEASNPEIAAKWDKLREREGRKKQRNAPVSDRKQMKRMARDRIGGAKEDPLAQKQSYANSADAKDSGAMAMKRDSSAVRGAKIDALRDRQSQRQMVKKKASDAATSAHLARGAEAGAAEYAKGQADKKAARQEKGAKAIGFLKKVASAPHRAVGAVLGKTAEVGANLAGRAIQHTKNQMQARAQTSTSGEGGATQPETGGGGGGPGKPSLLHKVGQGLGGFVKGIRAGYKGQTPGQQHVMNKAKEKKKEVPVQGPAVTATNVGESSARQGSVLSEMRAVLDNGGHARIPSPADVLFSMESRDIVGQAVIEALSQLNWDEVSQIASVSLIPAEDSYMLVTAYQEGRDSFFHAWRDVESRGRMPSPLTKESFNLLASLSIDEGVVPRLVGYSVEALRGAGPDVAMCVEDAYPDLGRTVYGPAGDPREGPEAAKSYMSPYPCSTDSPQRGQEVMTTRMFSDPDSRSKERVSKLADVMVALRGMEDAADDSGVSPEGMFLNTYRDLHREKVRYS